MWFKTTIYLAEVSLANSLGCAQLVFLLRLWSASCQELRWLSWELGSGLGWLLAGAAGDVGPHISHPPGNSPRLMPVEAGRVPRV